VENVFQNQFIRVKSKIWNYERNIERVGGGRGGVKRNIPHIHTQHSFLCNFLVLCVSLLSTNLGTLILFLLLNYILSSNIINVSQSRKPLSINTSPLLLVVPKYHNKTSKN
jgi:hypothetical protein